jgi:ABC-type uncharacterized transport system fused permease/ATPase subunit
VWLLTSAVLFFLFANLGAALAFNRWYKFFFDALEQKDTRTVALGLGLVLALALFSAAFSVGLLHARMRLQLRWRQWLTRTLIGRWLADRHFYQLTIVHTEADNPEARIAEDGQDCGRTSGRFFTRRPERLAGRGRLHRHPLGRRRLADRGGLFDSRLHGVRLHHLFHDYDA